MRKKLLIILAVLACIGLFNLPVKAQALQVKIDDQAQILDNPTELQSAATQLAEQTKAGVFVVTTTSNQQSPQLYSKEYLANQVGAGHNGIVLLIDMGQRKVYIWATGNLRYYMTSSRINSTLDVVQPALSSQTYQQAVLDFFTKVGDYYQAGIPGNRKYTVDETTGQVTFHRSFQPLAIAVALLVALLVTGAFVGLVVSRYQLKIGGKWHYPYAEKGQISLSSEQDLLINSFITTRQIPRNDSNDFGGGNSGGSGGGRSF